eukprot:517265_1
MDFFIELPTKIISINAGKQIDNICDYFNFIAAKELPIQQQNIGRNLKQFEFSDEDMFVLKYLDALDQNLLIIDNDNRNVRQWTYDTHPFKILFDRKMHLIRKYSHHNSNQSNTKVIGNVKSFKVTKINKFGQHQKRTLVISQTCLQNIKGDVITSSDLWKNVDTSFVDHQNTLIISYKNRESRKYQSDKAVEIHQLIQNKLNSQITIIYLRSFLDFLYQQFVALAGSTVLISSDIAIDVAGKFRKKKFVQYHNIIASSFESIAKYFACNKFQIDY